MSDVDLDRIESERDRIRDDYLRRRAAPARSSARGLHHVALLCSDVERTVRFYQERLEFPLDRDLREPRLPRLQPLLLRHRQRQPARLLRLPGLDLGPYAEVLGGLHHIAISVEPERWEHLQGQARRGRRGVPAGERDSIYFRDPDGARLS